MIEHVKEDPRGRGTMLSRDKIIEAALDIADSESDLDKLTIRRLASDLGVGAMTLYAYFRGGREEILDGMADHILGTIRVAGEIVPILPPSRIVDSALTSTQASPYINFRSLSKCPILSSNLSDSDPACDRFRQRQRCLPGDPLGAFDIQTFSCSHHTQ